VDPQWIEDCSKAADRVVNSIDEMQIPNPKVTRNYDNIDGTGEPQRLTRLSIRKHALSNSQGDRGQACEEVKLCLLWLSVGRMDECDDREDEDPATHG
jgi:hypothetical protein